MFTYSYGDVMKKGFTLAEVLITLGIIGIVAALTIPTLIQNYQKRETLVKFKKSYSLINQALKMAQVENGDMNTWTEPSTLGVDKWGATYIEPYLRIAKKCTRYDECGYKTQRPFTSVDGSYDTFLVTDQSRVTYELNDGSVIIIKAYDETGNPEQPYGFTRNVIIDLNGSAEPNVLGKDVFSFNRTEKGLEDYCREENDQYIKDNCTVSAGRCCSTKLINDGWEIKDDYPW